MTDQPYKLLIIEDDIAILELLSEVLAEEGYTVVKARHGAEALELLEKGFTPTLIFMDLFMPTMNGWQFVDALKAKLPAVYSSIPILVASAAGARAQSISPFVTELIAKPLDLDALLQTIGRLVRSHDAARPPEATPLYEVTP